MHSPQCTLLCLPRELFAKILRTLPIEELISVYTTCKTLAEALNDSEVLYSVSNGVVESKYQMQLCGPYTADGFSSLVSWYRASFYTSGLRGKNIGGAIFDDDLVAYKAAVKGYKHRWMCNRGSARVWWRVVAKCYEGWTVAAGFNEGILSRIILYKAHGIAAYLSSVSHIWKDALRVGLYGQVPLERPGSSDTAALLLVCALTRNELSEELASWCRRLPLVWGRCKIGMSDLMILESIVVADYHPALEWKKELLSDLLMDGKIEGEKPIFPALEYFMKRYDLLPAR